MGRKKSVTRPGPAEQHAPATLTERKEEIISALRLGLEVRGHPCDGRSATVHGVEFKFRCYEPLRRTRVPLSPQELRHGYGQTTKQLLAPGGRLALVAKAQGPHSGGERRWMDKARPLEAQIDEIFLRFEAIAQGVLKDRAWSEAYNRELEVHMRKAARRLQREWVREERPERLRKLAADWQSAERLRAFLDALETRLGSGTSPALTKWWEWARGHVEAIDPLSPAGLHDLQALAETLDHHPEDDDEPHPEEQEWRDMDLLDQYMDDEP